MTRKHNPPTSHHLTRRQFGGGLVAASIASVLPFESTLRAAGLTASSLASDVIEAAEYLEEQARLCALGAFNENPNSAFEYVREDTEHPFVWFTYYERLVQGGDWVRECIETGSPDELCVLSWARTLMPPPCERALTYWKPITGLSDEGKVLSSAFFSSLGKALYAQWAFNAHCTTENLLYVEDAPDYRQRLTTRKAADEDFSSAFRDVLDFSGWVAPGDRELRMRALQRYGESAVLDLPYLRANIPDWKSGERSWNPKRCGALPCAACDRWLS